MLRLLSTIALCTIVMNTAYSNDRLESLLKSRQDSELFKQFDKQPAPMQNSASSIPKVVLAVSSSVPMITLRRYAEQLEKIDGSMVIRGGIGGLEQIGPTLNWLEEVVSITPDCHGEGCRYRAIDIGIDPIVFQDWGITRVPALVLVDRYSGEPYCETPPDEAQAIAYGDAGVNILLQEIKRQLPSSSRQLIDQLIRRIEG